MRRGARSFLSLRLAPLLAGAALACLSLPAAADPAEIEDGMRVYRTSGECEKCHGWQGYGVNRYDSGWIDPPPSLIASRLTRAQVIELLSCGTPGGWMPQYLARAWTEERRCNGRTLSELAPELRPKRPYSALSQRQIEAAASFVVEVYQGKGMSLGDCLAYFGPASRACDLLR